MQRQETIFERRLVETFTRMVRPLPWLMLLFFVFYAAHLTSFHVPVDAEMAGLRAGTTGPDGFGPVIWVQQGRWGIYLIERFLVPQPVVPFLPLASFGFLTAVGYLLFLYAYGKRRMPLEGYLLFPIFSAFPTWYFLIQFPANLLATGLGITLSGTFVVALRATLYIGRSANSNRRKSLAYLYVTQIVTAVLAISVYQSFAALLVAGGLGVVVVSALKLKTPIQKVSHQIVSLGVVIFVSVVLYFATFKMSLIVLNVRPSYLWSFYRPDYLQDNLFKTMSDTISQLVAVYGGSRDVYGLSAWSFALVPLVSFFALASTNRLNGQPAMRGIMLAVWATILFIPFAQNLLSRGTMPYRSLISVPISLWFCAFIGFELGGKIVRRAMAAAVVLVLVQALYIFALFEGAEAIARQYDRRIAEEIYTRILQVRERANATSQPDVAFFGSLPLLRNIYAAPPSETVGRAIFGWGDNSTRIISLYQFLGFPMIRAISDQQRSDLKGEFAAMGVWPAANSVGIVGNVTLVKLSNFPN